MNNTSLHTNHRTVLPLVASRAKSAGAAGERWLAGLDNMISELEEMWNVTVGKILTGGSHAFVAEADGITRGAASGEEKYVLKIEMPENYGGDFLSGITVLKLADGQGYAKLYAYDAERMACLLERLGKPISELNYPIREQLRIICSTLEKSWGVPAADAGLSSGEDSVLWFREFIGKTWEKLNRPCSRKVIDRAFAYTRAREQDMHPEEFVLLHGDAHSNNILRELTESIGFKFIDPDGIFYEKAYDLGVLMREWVEEYECDPVQKGRERCALLHRLTGVPRQAIWEWGYLQTVSTSLILLQTGRNELGRKMLRVAEHWASET